MAYFLRSSPSSSSRAQGIKRRLSQDPLTRKFGSRLFCKATRTQALASFEDPTARETETKSAPVNVRKLNEASCSGSGKEPHSCGLRCSQGSSCRCRLYEAFELTSRSQKFQFRRTIENDPRGVSRARSNKRSRLATRGPSINETRGTFFCSTNCAVCKSHRPESNKGA